MFANTFRLPSLRYKHHLSSATVSFEEDSEQKRKEQQINRQRQVYHRHRQDKLLDKTRETKLLEVEIGEQHRHRETTKLLKIEEQHKIEMTHQQLQLVEEGEDDKLHHRRRLDLQQDTGGDCDSVDMHKSNSSFKCSPPTYIYATSISSSSSQDEMEVCRRQSAAAIRRYYSQNSKMQQDQYRNTSDEHNNQDSDASDAPPHISFDYGSDVEEEEDDLNSIWCQSNQIKKESD